MKIAIVGAGFTGLTAAYELSKRGHQVIVFEKNNFAGGLASGIRNLVDNYPDNWWDLERFQHHFFANDAEAFKLIAELGLSNKLLKLSPKTSILYHDKIYRFDSPLSFLTFPRLVIFEKFKLGAALSYLKLTKNWKRLERETVDSWWRGKIGERPYKMLWEPLLKGKFGSYFKEINMAWFWARIKKRTQKLYYFEKGFQNLIDALIEKIKKQGGEIEFNQHIQRVETHHGVSLQTVNGAHEGFFDKLIVTTSPDTLVKLIPNLPANYKNKISKLKMLSAQALILFLKKPLLSDGTYWLNINDSTFPFLSVVEHTNFVDLSHYGNIHIVYVGNYLKKERPLMKMGKKELLETFLPYLKKLNPNFSESWILKSLLFREDFAQPTTKINHSKNILPFKTPLKNIYFASMSQIYPWDRGVNYAIEMGKKVAKEILNSKS